MIIVSYTSSEYYLNMEDMLHECCEKFGIKHVRYNREWFITTDFCKEHMDIANQKRGAGFWSWKPSVILDAFQYDDTVVYLDASVVFDEDPYNFVDENQYMTVGHHGKNFMNREWIKRDAFVLMNCDKPEYWNDYQVWAGQVVVGKYAIHLVEEWKFWCGDRRIITDLPNMQGSPNFPEFVDHRHDQAILSILSTKYPDSIHRANSVFHDYGGNYTEWVSWKAKGRR